MFYRSCSTCRCIFHVFVGKKVISTSYSSAIFRWMNLIQRFMAYNFISSKSSKSHFQWKPTAQLLRIIFCCLKLFLCKSSGTAAQSLLPSQQKAHSRLSRYSHLRPLTSQPSLPSKSFSTTPTLARHSPELNKGQGSA